MDAWMGRVFEPISRFGWQANDTWQQQKTGWYHAWCCDEWDGYHHLMGWKLDGVGWGGMEWQANERNTTKKHVG